MKIEERMEASTSRSAFVEVGVSKFRLQPGHSALSVQKVEIETEVRSLLSSLGQTQNDIPLLTFQGFPLLSEFVERVVVSKGGLGVGAPVILDDAFLRVCAMRLYQLCNDGPLAEELGSEGDSPEETVAACHQWDLPNLEFDSLWDSLIFDSDAKEKILSYAFSMMRFSDRGVNSSLVTANRLVLLHGPPGTGKTTLCKAAAQKLSIRMGDRYPKSVFVEINSHSLFSRWFSESGKLVMKMFERIQALLGDPLMLVFVLIDEVESLTVARKASMAGNEPSDAVRVVNALLTQIDFIRRWPNVLILTTSNLAEAVDAAFLDRADLKQYIPPPSKYAIYSIYLSCIKELQRTSIIDARDDVSADPRSMESAERGNCEGRELSEDLLAIAEKSVGLSGRTIRKLPVLADAFFHQHQELTRLKEFLGALSTVINDQIESRRAIHGHTRGGPGCNGASGKSHPDRDRGNDSRIYVGNLPPDIRTKDIEDFFHKFGKINFVDLKNKKGPPFAFIEFEDKRVAEEEVKSRDGYRPREEFPQGSGPKGPGERRLWESGGGGGGRMGRGSGPSRRTTYRVMVTGLPPTGSRQDLKDHMREAGDVCYADVFRDGTGVVEYLRYDDMKYAMRKLDDTKFRSHKGETSYVRVKEETDRRDSRNGHPHRDKSRSRSPRPRASSTYSPARGRRKSRSSRSRSGLGPAPIPGPAADPRSKSRSRSPARSKSRSRRKF